MNYQKHYNLLIDRAKTRLLEIYTETHHIIPRCLGGSNLESNLVELTPEEHFVAHQLLIKIYPHEPKLVFAANMMTLISPKHVGCRSKNKTYGWLKVLHSKAQSETAKLAYVTNPNYGMSNKKHSKETIKKMKKAHSHPAKVVTCPNCKKKGGIHNMKRYHFNNCDKPNPTSTCPHCNKTGGVGIMKRWHFDNCKNRVIDL